MPKCINDPSRTYKGTEPSPKGLGYCAHSEKIGTKKKGLDGNNWEIKQNKKGINRWVKVNSNKKKETILLNSFINKYILPIIKNWDYDTTFDIYSLSDYTGWASNTAGNVNSQGSGVNSYWDIYWRDTSKTTPNLNNFDAIKF